MDHGERVMGIFEQVVAGLIVLALAAAVRGAWGYLRSPKAKPKDARSEPVVTPGQAWTPPPTDPHPTSLSAYPKPPGWPLKRAYERPVENRRVRGIGLVVLALVLAFGLYLIYWGQIFSQVKPHAHNFFVSHGISTYGGSIIGDGGAPGIRAARIETISPVFYRVFMPADTGWDPTQKFWPGDVLDITVEQPKYIRIGAKGSKMEETVEGVMRDGRLKTPQDLRLGQAQFYLDQELAVGGLLLKYGDNGLKRFCGQGGVFTCPGGIRQLTPDPREVLYFAINLGQTPEQRALLEGTVIFTIRVVHSKHAS